MPINMRFPIHQIIRHRNATIGSTGTARRGKIARGDSQPLSKTELTFHQFGFTQNAESEFFARPSEHCLKLFDSKLRRKLSIDSSDDVSDLEVCLRCGGLARHVVHHKSLQIGCPPKIQTARIENEGIA